MIQDSLFTLDLIVNHDWRVSRQTRAIFVFTFIESLKRLQYNAIFTEFMNFFAILSIDR